MPSIYVSTTVNNLKLGSSDKKALTTLINNLVDDIGRLRTANAALAAKLDADVGVTDTNYAATSIVTAAQLAVGK